MASIETFLTQYGLFALFAGAGIEGEAVVITGGALSAKGYFPLWAAMITATLGSTIVDQFWFFLARYSSNNPLVRKTSDKPVFARALRFLERHPNLFILSFRFIYGMRTVSPIAVGLSRVETKRFVILNVFAAAIWAPLFVLIGYQLGPHAMAWLRNVPGYAIALALLGLLAVALIVVHFVRNRTP